MNFRLSFRYPPTEDRVKCGSWGGGVILILRKAYISGHKPSTMSRTVKKVCGGGWVGGG